MIVRTRPRRSRVGGCQQLGDFGFVREVPKTMLSDEELARRWEECPKELSNINSFCDCVFPEEENIRVACKTKPWSCNPFGIVVPWAPPWGEYGAGCRYMPYPKPSFLYGVGISTDAVSLVGIAADPLQKGEIRELEKKEAKAVAIQAEQAAAYQQQLAQKKAQGRTITTYAITAGATGLAFILVAALAKKRRSSNP